MRFEFLGTTGRILVLLTMVFVVFAPAQSYGATERVLFLFGESAPFSGDQSVTSLTWDDAGNLYGSTIAGGLYPGGIVFKMTNLNGTWSFTVLYNFGSIPNDGSYSASPLVFDANGNLYGTTQQGGAYGSGTVFELIPTQSGQWTEKQLYSFQGGIDGAYPQGSIALDSAGNLYGITTGGGSSSGFGYGTVFEVVPTRSGTWRERLLHKFTGGLDGEFRTEG